MNRRPADDRPIGFSISRIISALDDRNLSGAMRLLEPAESSELLSDPDRREGARCVRCITRGE